MKRLIFAFLVMIMIEGPVFSQGLNKIVYGPLEGDDAGILTVLRNCGELEVEMWVRTDPGNPGPVHALCHALMSEDYFIAERNGIIVEPLFDEPNWEWIFVDGPYSHNPEDPFPIPEGWTCELQTALPHDYPSDTDEMDTEGEWVLYGTWLMVTNTDVPGDQSCFPFADGWFPWSGQGTNWTGEGWSLVPETEFCGIYFEPDTCAYIPGDVNHNGAPLELADVLAMIDSYRGTVELCYTCICIQDPPIYNFPATADPNGNCTPNELNDVVTEIGAYRGEMSPSGCPDCPGSD